MTNAQDPPPTQDPDSPVDLVPILHPDDIPDFATEAEVAHYWDTHCLGFIWDQLEDVTDNPPWGDTPPRPTPNARKRPAAPPIPPHLPAAHDPTT